MPIALSALCAPAGDGSRESPAPRPNERSVGGGGAWGAGSGECIATRATIKRVTGLAVAANLPLAVVGAGAVLVVAPQALAASPHAVSPRTIERDLTAGRSFVDEDATIHGDIKLNNEIPRPFVCNGCVFKGDIIAPYVVFEREVDLSGSTISGGMNLHGALFKEPALFKQTKFVGKVEFDFAAFNELAVFRESAFSAAAGFTSAQFRSVARFGGATFTRDASFSDSIFGAEGLFAGATFIGVAEFPGAVFGGVSDFREASFLGGTRNSPKSGVIAGKPGADFTKANFVGRAEFSKALIDHEADFDGARFGGDVLFVRTTFGADRPAVVFEDNTVRGKIDLQELNPISQFFNGSVQFRSVSADSLSFDAIPYGPSEALNGPRYGQRCLLGPRRRTAPGCRRLS